MCASIKQLIEVSSTQNLRALRQCQDANTSAYRGNLGLHTPGSRESFDVGASIKVRGSARGKEIEQARSLQAETCEGELVQKIRLLS